MHLESVSFISPMLFLMVLPLLGLLVWRMLARRRLGTFPLTGLEYLQSRQCLGGRWRKQARLLLWVCIALLLGLLWAAPVLYTSEPLYTGVEQRLRKNFLVVFDMSPSMNLPVDTRGYGGEDLEAGEQGSTRYETAREALFEFLERFEGERFGLILFSTEPFLARWPTTETGNRFREVLGENIRRGSGTQLESFSSLTNIDKALQLAQDVFGGEEGAIIMISDGEDDLENLGTAVHRLRSNGIRLYTIGVGISEEVINELSSAFADDQGFRIFRVDSEADMREAYRVVGRVEESSLFTREQSRFESELRWLLSLLLAGIAVIGVWLDQTLLHEATGRAGTTAETEQGRHGF